MEICHSFAALKTNKYTHVENCSSSVNKFILLGFPYTWDIRILCFSVFSGTYILTLIGNLCIICAVRCDHQLQTPMYILLANFSFLEMWYVTSTVPSMLANFPPHYLMASHTGLLVLEYINLVPAFASLHLPHFSLKCAIPSLSSFGLLLVLQGVQISLLL